MCGIMGCVLQFVELVGYLGCDVKKTGLQLHLVFLTDISHRHFWEISANMLFIINLDKVNVYHDISIHDFITI